MAHNRSRSDEPALARRAPAMQATVSNAVSSNQQAIMNISQSSNESSIMDVRPVPVVQQTKATAIIPTVPKRSGRATSSGTTNIVLRQPNMAASSGPSNRNRGPLAISPQDVSQNIVATVTPIGLVVAGAEVQLNDQQALPVPAERRIAGMTPSPFIAQTQRGLL